MKVQLCCMRPTRFSFFGKSFVKSSMKPKTGSNLMKLMMVDDGQHTAKIRNTISSTGDLPVGTAKNLSLSNFSF